MLSVRVYKRMSEQVSEWVGVCERERVCVCALTFQLSYQLTSFHETWQEEYATR